MSQTTNDSIITIEFQPVAIIIGPFQRFFNKIVSGSYPLFLAAILAMIWANLLAASYHSFWHTQLSLSFGQFTISKSLNHWTGQRHTADHSGIDLKRYADRPLEFFSWDTQ